MTKTQTQETSIAISGERCERPKKNGEPCRNMGVHGSGTPCRNHITDLDRHYLTMINESFMKGHRAGSEDGRQAYKRDLEKAAREAEDKLNFRLETLDGKQIVEVNGYAYTWDRKNGGGPLEIGDTVHLSGGYSGGWEGTVTKIGSSYRGNISEISRRA